MDLTHLAKRVVAFAIACVFCTSHSYARDQEQLAQNLATYLSIPTVSMPPGSLERSEAFDLHLDFLRAQYPTVFSELEVDLISNYTLLIRWPGSDSTKEPVLFTAHSDVVPVEPGSEALWTHPPFAGVIADGKIWGRGALDDKSGVISLFEAFEKLLLNGHKPVRDVYLGIGHDEEVSGALGAKKIAEKLQSQGRRFAFVIDEGGMIMGEGNPFIKDQQIAMINIAEKTYLTITLVAKGPGGHSSGPPKSTTAGRIARAITRLESNPFPPALSEPVRKMLAVQGQYSSFPRSWILNNLWLTEPLVLNQMMSDSLASSLIRTTTAVTMVHGGTKENSLPQRTEAKVNFRLLPNISIQQVVERVRYIIDDDSIEVIAEGWDPGVHVSKTGNKSWLAIHEGINKVYPGTISMPGMIPATTDARYYIALSDSVYRFHGVKSSPAEFSSIHGNDERIGVESFAKAVRVAEEIIKSSDKM